MNPRWTVKKSDGELLAHFACDSPLEVARKIVPGRYDAFRLHVSPSYRELFDRAVKQILDREDWQIVRMRGAGRARRAEALRLVAERM